jgi:selT/selW/selH-like putative selenoprotein
LNDLGVEADIIPGGRGVFDVLVDGEPVFSKYEVGRFPEQGEMVGKIQQLPQHVRGSG